MLIQVDPICPKSEREFCEVIFLREPLEEYQHVAEYLQLMQFACDHVPEDILVADSNKRFRYVNQAACQSLGYTKEELEALRIPDIAPNHENRRYQNHLRELREGKNLSYHTTHRTKHGQELPMNISVYLLNFQGQEFTCAITSLSKKTAHYPQKTEANLGFH